MDASKPKAKHVHFGKATVITYTPMPQYKTEPRRKAPPVYAPAFWSRQGSTVRQQYVIRNGAAEHIEVVHKR